MKKITFFLICLLLVFFFSRKVYQLKILGYQYVPEANEILDEYHFAWLGKSILTTGVPTTWSDLGAYPNEIKEKFNLKVEDFSIKADERKPSFNNFRSFPKPLVKVETLDYGRGAMQIRFVQPYLDHPPLAGLIYALGINNKTTTFKDVKPEQFRRPNIWLSYLVGLLIFLLGAQLAGPWVGLIAFLFYSTVPSFVFASRFSLAENVLIPFFLASANFLFLGKRFSKLIFFILAGFLAGLAALTKLSGWGVILAGLFCLFYWKKSIKEFLSFLIPGIFIGSLYFIYGWYLGGSLFWQIFLNQSARFFWGALGFGEQIAKVNLLHFPLDGWWLGGFVILVYLAAFKENRELVLMALAYFLTILFLGGGNYAWYYFPFIPFLALAIAILIMRLMTKPLLADLSLFFIFPFSSSFYWGFSVFHQNWSLTWLYRMLILIFILLALFFIPKIKNSGLAKLIWVIFFIFLIHRLYLWNFRSVLFLLENWGKLQAPLINL